MILSRKLKLEKFLLGIHFFNLINFTWYDSELIESINFKYQIVIPISNNKEWKTSLCVQGIHAKRYFYDRSFFSFFHFTFLIKSRIFLRRDSIHY